MKFDIRPFNGIGPIKFGMDRSEVRKILKVAFKEDKPYNRANILDVFDKLGVMVAYDEKSNKCEFVSIWLKKRPVIFRDKLIFEQSPTQTMKWIKDIDKTAKLDAEDTLTSKECGLSIGFDSHPDDPESQITNVAVFTEDYYKKEIGD